MAFPCSWSEVCFERSWCHHAETEKQATQAYPRGYRWPRLAVHTTGSPANTEAQPPLVLCPDSSSDTLASIMHLFKQPHVLSPSVFRSSPFLPTSLFLALHPPSLSPSLAHLSFPPPPLFSFTSSRFFLLCSLFLRQSPSSSSLLVSFSTFQNSVAQCVVPRPAAAAPGNSLEMLDLGSHPRPAASDTWGWEEQQLGLSETLQGISCTLKFENHNLRGKMVS